MSPGSDEGSVSPNNISSMIGKTLMRHTKLDNIFKHCFCEDESKMYIYPVFRTRTATKTSDSHSRQNSAAFFEKALLPSVSLLRLCPSRLWVTLLYPRRYLGHRVDFCRDEIIWKSHDSRRWGLLSIFFLDIEDCCGGLKTDWLFYPAGDAILQGAAPQQGRHSRPSLNY